MSTYGVNFKFNMIGGNIGKMFASIDRLNSKARVGFGKTDKAILKNDKSVSKLVSGVEKFAKKTIKLPTRGWTKTDRSVKRVLVRVRQLDRRFASLTKGMQGGFDKMTRRLGSFGTTMAGLFAMHQAKEFYNIAVNGASDLVEATNKANVIFGDNNSVVKWAEKSAVSMGLAKQVAIEGTATFGGFFKNIGIDSEKLPQMSKGIVQLAADLGSFNNMSSQQAMENLMSAFRGSTEVLDNLNITANEAMIKQEALDRGFIKSAKGSLPPLIRTQALYSLILKQSQTAMGDFSKTSGDYANGSKILRAKVINLTTSIGQKLLPTATLAVSKLTSMVDWVSRNSEAIKAWLKPIAMVAGVFGTLWIAAKTILGIAAFIGTVKKAFILLKVVMLASNPFGWAIAAVGFIAALIASTENLKTVFDWIYIWAAKLLAYNPFTWLVNVVDKVFPGFKNSLKSWIGDIKAEFLNMVNWFYDKFIQPIAGYWDKLKGLFGFGSKPIQKIKVEGDVGNGADADVKSLYNDVNGILGGGSPNSPKSPSGSSVSDRIASVSAKGGGSVRNINLRIDKLVEVMNINTENVEMATSVIRAEVAKALIGAVNDVNHG